MAQKRTADKQHRWLSQVEVTGVVFSEPVLADAAPAGFPSLDKRTLARFYKAREIWNLPKGMVAGDGQTQWIQFVFDEILRLNRPEDWLVGSSIPSSLVFNLAQQQETVRPSQVLIDDGAPALVVLEVPRNQSLDKPWVHQNGKWKASPTTKLERLLRESDTELGLVTNGEAWRLLVASPSETASWITWTSRSWGDSPITLAAFRDLLGEERFFAGDKENVVLELIKRSRERQLDVADQLGHQVREALSLLVRELDRANNGAQERFLDEYSEDEIFESTVAFVMRLLFVLYAEENGLLPHGSAAYDTAYGVLHLLTELENQGRIAPEKLERSYGAYSRLLASARLIHTGSIDPDIRVAAHGGTLFDAKHYPMLEGRTRDGCWPGTQPETPRIRDSIVRQILRSLKYARSDGARQLVSYRTLAVEQIGHMYEGLLDRRVARAPEDEAIFLLKGSSKIPEPEPLRESDVDGLVGDELLKILTKHTGRTKKTLQDLLEKPENRIQLPDPGTRDPNLLARSEPIQRFLLNSGIVQPAGLFVTAGSDRRTQGAHYTPPALTEPIVKATLTPQIEAMGDSRTPEKILDLKVCDLAMGSGAFLVQVVRQLAEYLVDSWEVRANDSRESALTMPMAVRSEGLESELLLPESREERLIFARRYVAERCIYGVDKNKYAVEMAKLSLWIATLSAERPFTFLDHALKHGDSLIGLTLEQTQAFHWHGHSRDLGPLFQNIPNSVNQVINARQQIKLLSDFEFNEKSRQAQMIGRSTRHIALIGDLCLAAYLGARHDKDREVMRRKFRYQLDRAIAIDELNGELLNVVHELRDGELPVSPFHWELEFPEVFEGNNPGFDAVLGNPPFVGGTLIGGRLGLAYHDYLVDQFDPATGLADLIAFFFRRSFDLSKIGGTIGMIATNTISQGDTRTTGLQQILSRDGQIYDARRRHRWPGHASVIVSLIHLSKGRYDCQPLLDGDPVDRISAYLLPGFVDETPKELSENKRICYRGTKVWGSGFVFENSPAKGSTSIEEMERILSKDPRNQDVISKYLGGADFNSHPQQLSSRYVIDFGDMPKQDAMTWPDLFSIVEKRVRPIRAKNKQRNYRENWWLHANRVDDAGPYLEKHGRLLALTCVSQHLALAFVERGTIIQDRMMLFLLSQNAEFAVLQSRIHEVWVRLVGTTLGDAMSYTTICFDTFPLPKNDRGEPKLGTVGKTYYEFRKNLMIQSNQGLTKTYNRFHDPDVSDSDIEKLRELHCAMDNAVLDAYGWSDIETSVDFFLDFEIDEKEWGGKKKPYRLRWPNEVRDEILARLLKLNQERNT